MTADTTANVHRIRSPRIFAVAETTAYLRSTVAVLLAVAAVFVASRRLAGALETPLGPLQLLVAAGLLAGLARIAHALSQTGRLRAGSVLISLAMLTLAASLSLPGSNSIALLGFWAMIVGEEFWAWRSMSVVETSANRLSPSATLPCRGEGRLNALLSASSPADGDMIEEPEPTEPGADVLQQLTLRTTAEGSQELSGWLRTPLAAGQRTASLHVAFCPSFSQTPQVQAEPVAGPDCRIKVAQVLPYGARLDVKLDEPARGDDNVLVWFFASPVSWPSQPGAGSCSRP